jgi:hypothetical protein
MAERLSSNGKLVAQPAEQSPLRHQREAAPLSNGAGQGAVRSAQHEVATVRLAKPKKKARKKRKKQNQPALLGST